MVMGKKKGGAKTGKRPDKVKRNPLFEDRKKNFRVGNDVQPKRDLTRFVRWPKYILLQRQKRILLQRVKVPPTIHQFSKTLDKNGAAALFKLLKKYSPETKKEKKTRLQANAQQKVEGKQADSKKPMTLKYGLNHITHLVEEKKAKLVVIANDVDPIELVLWLPQLCRKQNVPFCFVKNKARLGTLVGKKTATAIAVTEVRKEDASELDLYSKNYLAAYNENIEIRKTWGGGILGQKSQHQVEQKQKAYEAEQLKKANI